MMITQDAELKNSTQRIVNLLGNGINYAVCLETRVCSGIDADTDLQKLYEAAASDGLVWRHKKIEPSLCTFEEDVEIESARIDIFSDISNEGDDGAGPLLTDDQLSHLRNELLPQLWARIEELLSIQDVKVCKVNPPESDMFYMIFSGFCYFAKSLAKGTGVFIYWAASD